MTRRARTLWLGLLVFAGCEPGFTSTEPPQPSLDVELRRSLAQWGVIPIGPMPPQDAALVRLGQALFFDRILSGNRDVSCATCHQPDLSLADGRSLAIGTGAVGLGHQRRPGPGRQFVPRSSPSLLNGGIGMPYLFWDGRLSRFEPVLDTLLRTLPTGLSDILVAQAMLPVVTPTEMLGLPGDIDVFGKPNELTRFGPGDEPEIWRALTQRLLDIPEYVQLFGAAFPDRRPDQLRFEHAALAIAAFERDAFTRTRSPFDRYLNRQDAALTVEQKRGALLFFDEARCGSCHGGPFLGGQQFANIGAPQIGPGVGREAPLDIGRGAVIDNEFYRFAFRVAPLRNVELTAPYMHSGAYATLEDVVRHYDDVPLALRNYDPATHAPAVRDLYHGDARTIDQVLETLDHRLRASLDLTDDEIRQLVAFLRSLTDPDARDLRHLVPERVPSGLPIG